ncbi:glycosyltransferase [Fusobacterium varium]|uniref:glycosyltransferase n=1 Tax=Fusobacterium varium TaxID=856 RepID=UPI0035694C2C
MKKILFKVKGLGIGGIERLAIDILNNLKLEDKKIILLIENKEENFLEGQLNKNIEKVYLKPDWFNPFLIKIKSRKKNIFYKLLYNILMSYEKIILSKSINNYIENNKEAEIFIDYNGEAGKYIHKIKNIKKVMWIHLSFLGIKENKRKKLEKRFQNFDKIVTICDEMEEEVRKLFPILEEKIIKIYNFINFEKIEEKLSKFNLNIQEEKMLKENYCISVGRLATVKDYETIINAFKILNEKGINEKLYIIGDGNNRENLEKMIKVNRLENQIFLLGAKNNPYIWMKNADIFIHSSKLEGFGLVIVEAMYCGVPIISSNFKCGAKEILLNGEYGELFEIGNFEELAQKIEKLLFDNDKKQKYILKAKKMTKKFSMKNILIEYKKLLEEN